MAHILIVEDDREMLETLSLALRSRGHSVVTAGDGGEGVERFSVSHFDLVVTDILMPDLDGLGMIEEMKRMAPSIKIVAMSGGGTAAEFDFLDAAKKRGVIATLTKPFQIAVLNELVDRCLGCSPSA